VNLRFTGRWLAPFVVARFVASAFAAVIVLYRGITPGELPLLVAALAYGPVTGLAAVRFRDLRRSPWFWAGDFAVALALIVASEDWRSPFYVLWLTTLALPAAKLDRRAAPPLAAGAFFAYLGVALVDGPFPGTGQPVSSETLAIHLVLPVLVVAGIAYAADTLRRLEAERSRAERLAIESERRRIAWELHDSAKQRLHAAHLVVSSLEGRVAPELEPAVQQTIAELESASSDMDTSLAELRSPLEGRRLDQALRERAAEMQLEGGPAVHVSGEAPDLPALQAAHVFRIATEAMTNAVRHAGARRVDVVLDGHDHAFVLRISDDGRGLPEEIRPQASGLHAMRSRATSIGARLSVAPATAGTGTDVVLELASHKDRRTT
jgi:signal transduction histidine kinase